MFTGAMHGVWRSNMSRLVRSFACGCSGISVKEAERDEVEYQTRAGRQSPSCQRNPSLASSMELLPQTATGAVSGCAAEAEPKDFVPTSVDGIVPSNKGNEEQPGSIKGASRANVPDGLLGPGFPSVAEPSTPSQLTPVTSGGLLQATLETNDVSIESVTSAIVSGTPAVEPEPSLAPSSIHSDDIAAVQVLFLGPSGIVSGNDINTAASEPVLCQDVSSTNLDNNNSSASEPESCSALSSTNSDNSSSIAAESVKSPALSSFSSSDSDSSCTTPTPTTTTTSNISSSGSVVSSSKLSYGVATATNQRPHQEDRASAEVFDCSKHAQGFHRLGAAAVYDGHGGSEASDYLQQNFIPLLMKQLQLGANPQEAAAAAAQQVETHLLSTKCIAGSTLTAAVVLDDQLIVAQVGDSRAVLCSAGGKVIQLTADHKPTDAAERERITTADPTAEVSSDGYCYGMGVSRGLGSYQLKSDGSKKAFIAAVDITVHQLQVEDAFIVLGSDGLFDSLQNQDVVTTARRVLAGAHGDCTGAAQSLVDRAIKMGSSDNVTAVVMLLHDRKIQLAKSNSRLFRNRD